MAKPSFNQIDHGQQSWDVDLQANFDLLENSVIPIPEYSSFSTLPSAASYDECVALTQDTQQLWVSDGVRWLPVNGIFAAQRGVALAYAAHGGGPGVSQVLATVQIPAGYLQVGDRLEITAGGQCREISSGDNGAAWIDWGSEAGNSSSYPGLYSECSPDSGGNQGAAFRMCMDVTVQVLDGGAGNSEQWVERSAEYQAVATSATATNTRVPRPSTQDESAAIDIDFVGSNVDGNNADAVIYHWYQVRIIPKPQ